MYGPFTGDTAGVDPVPWGITKVSDLCMVRRMMGDQMEVSSNSSTSMIIAGL